MLLCLQQLVFINSVKVMKCLEFYQNILGYLNQMFQKWIKNQKILLWSFWTTILAAPSTLSFKLSFKVWWPPSCGLFSLPFTGLKIVETTPKFLWTTSKKPFKQFFFKKEGKRIQLAPAATAPIKGVCTVQSNW